MLDQAERAFEKTVNRAAKRADDVKDRKIAALEEKLVKKNEVVAELMEEHVQLKKELGDRRSGGHVAEQLTPFFDGPIG